MANSAVVAISELITSFETDKSPKKITVTARVVKVEKFSDNYHDFDMNELMENKKLMEALLMEQKETKNSDGIIPVQKSYLPSDKELEIIKNNLSEMKAIEINEQSAIINYETKFRIDRFQFAIQFMLFPKSFIHCWLGFIATFNNSHAMRMQMGGIGGEQMGGLAPITNVVKKHYLSNLMISIPHRKPLSDEFGKTTMSSLALISGHVNDSNNSNIQQMGDDNFMLSSNDLALKLSKMLTRSSKKTVQISVDIPSQILNAPISNRNDLKDTNMLFEIEKTVLNIYKSINTSTK